MTERQWRQVAARDAGADGQFVFAVRTTGVYCRPSCGARRPRREHVATFADAAAAERAGFRACRRCRPGQAAALGPWPELCRWIEAQEAPPSLAALAARAGLSPAQLQRQFRRAVGVTPRAYALARRRERVRAALRAEATVTDAIYAAGYSGSGRFYADSNRQLGMTPTALRAGGRGAAITYAVAPCPLGRVLVAESERGVCAILLGARAGELAAELRRLFPQAEVAAGTARHLRRVLALVRQPERAAELPLDIRGTAFQQQVWRELGRIRGGATASYGEIARRLGRPKAVRAVAAACAANRLAVAIPCHRALGADGNLRGYRWGVERKQRLLEREKASGRRRAAVSGSRSS